MTDKHLSYADRRAITQALNAVLFDGLPVTPDQFRDVGLTDDDVATLGYEQADSVYIERMLARYLETPLDQRPAWADDAFLAKQIKALRGGDNRHALDASAPIPAMVIDSAPDPRDHVVSTDGGDNV